MQKSMLLAIPAALALLAGPALAQNATQRSQAAQGQTGTGPGVTNPNPAQSQRMANRVESTSAATFTRMAAMSDMFELESARLALERSQNQAIRSFAQHMQTDHQKTTQELQAQMRQANMTQATPQLDSKHTEMLSQLRNARGSDFDRLFAQQQVAAHQDAVDLFRNYGQAGDNAGLKQWASATLPALQEHLRMAQQLRH